jgi:hypothetical protein
MDRGAIFLGIVSTGFASSRPDVGVRTRPGDPEGPCLGRWSGVSSGCCPVSEVAACRAGYGWRGNTSMVASEPYACPVHRARRGHRDNARHRSHTRVPLTAPGAVKGTKPSRSRACDRFTAPPAGLAMRRSGVNVAGGRARGRVCRSAATPASVSVHRRPAPRTPARNRLGIVARWVAVRAPGARPGAGSGGSDGVGEVRRAERGGCMASLDRVSLWRLVSGT